METRKLLAAVLLPGLALGLATTARAQEEGEEIPQGMTARIEVKGNYYRAGEPIEVRVNLENLGDEAVANPDGIPIIPALELTVNDEPTRPGSVPSFDPATQPRTFAPRSAVTQIVDLAEAFPALAEAGKYSIRFRTDDIVSEPVELKLAPPYDPDLDYRARIKTDAGDITVELLESEAPNHVQNFVDLARQGYYDDTHIFLIAKGEMILAGSPEKDGTGGVEWVLQPELSNKPMARGMLFSVRTSYFDNANQFAISLRRNPDRDGKFSVFGQVIDSDETLANLEKIDTTGNKRAPFFQPLSDILVRGVVIEIVTEGAGNASAAEDSGR